MASYRNRNGTWEYRIRFKDVYTGKIREKSQSGFKRRIDAVHAAQKIELDLTDGYSENKSNPPFEKYMWHWYSLIEKTYRANTQLHRLQSIRRISSSIGKVPLRSITYEIVSHYLNQLVEQDYSKGIVSADYIVIELSLKQAVREKYFRNYPIEGIKMPKTKPEKKARFWTVHDLNYFIEKQNDKIEWLSHKPTKSHYYNAIRDYAIFCTLAGCGCRINELLGCLTDSYDPETRILKLHHNMVPIVKDRKGTNTFERTTFMKTSTSYREIPVPEITANALELWLSVRTPYIHNRSGDDNSLFPSPRLNRPLQSCTVTLNLERLCDEHDLKKINVHGFRHTYASFLLQSGVSPKQAQVLLGHEDIKTTLNIYTHVSMNSKIDAVSQLNDLLNKSLETKNSHLIN